MSIERTPAHLCLQDGSVFHGYSFGTKVPANGEVVFNTGMIGYPESLTDPSYRGQILVMTYPLIGNYGVPGDEMEWGLSKHFESSKIQVRGLVVTEYSVDYSHWEAKRSLDEWMKENGIPGIYGIDTRALTKHLREHGTLLGKITYDDPDAIGFEDPNKENLVSQVSIKEPVEYTRGKKRVLLIDCGVKNNIIKAFLRRDITVLRCPWDHEISKERFDGIVLSNGPGDPSVCDRTIENVRKALTQGVPILGICLGSQILGLAAGAKTYKLKYGHRGQNQPCVELGTKRCSITSQNHGYAVDSDTLPEDWHEWFYNNNDRTNEGIKHVSKPFFGAQFHPEASPGPDDTEFIFDMFVRAMR
jgi:carbamoyl-phosphate synthase small subunit